MKLRTEGEFQTYLDKQFGWRVQEIDRLKTAVRRATASSQSTLIRAGLPLVYAHWEGFVKAGAEAMLCYVATSRRRYRELAPCFAAHGLAHEMELLTTSKVEQRRAAAMEFILTRMDHVAVFKWQGRASAGGNLNYGRFCGIAAAVGLDTTQYDSRSQFIDKSLVERRNSIAHGELLDLDDQGFTEIADGVLMLIRWFKTDLENSISLKSYLLKNARGEAVKADESRTTP